MSSSKLDAKHERTLRTLLKQPDNRRCAVCETLGPQYVVINFSIFVCTNCSGVHRQFNHRCKGISMATFKPEEMRAIEEGGNAVALARYLAKWSPSDLPKPTDRTTSKVRDFIEIVFVKKRFADEHAPVPGGLARLQSTSSARSSMSRETDVVAAPPAAPQSSLIDLASPEKQGVAGAGAAARVHSSGAAVTPSHAAPAPADGWAAFGEAAEGVPGGADRPPAAAANGQPPAAPDPAAHGASWAQFDAPAAPAPSGAASQGPAAGSEEGGGGGGLAGWQAFGEALPSANGAAKPRPSAAAHEPRKELPSDLFCELPPQPQAPQAFGSGARTAPAGAYGGGFPPRPPGDHTRGSYSAGWAPSGPGAAAGAHAGNSAQPGGFYGGARQPAGDSLVASSGVHGSPEGSVRSAASEAAAPDPFSALMPGLRGAARAGSLGGDAAPAGPFAPAAGMPGGSAANGAQAGAAFPGTQQAPSVGSSASVPASPATPVPPGFAPTAPWAGAGAAPHGLAARQGSGAAHAAPLAQPGTGGGFAWGGAATPAAGGGFGAFFPASQAPAFEAQPYGMVHGGGLTGPRAGDGAAAAPAQTAAPGPALRKSSGNPFA